MILTWISWTKIIRVLQIFLILSVNILFGIIITEILLELGLRKLIKRYINGDR